MASLPFFDAGSRYVYDDTTGDPIKNGAAVLYSDENGTTLAQVFADSGGYTPGALIGDATVYTDTYGQLPVPTWGPVSGQTRLWMRVNGGPIWPVDAIAKDRIDGLDTRIVALETGQIGGAVSSVNGHVGTVVLVPADIAGAETTTGAQAKADAARTAALDALANHTNASTNVHGIADVTTLETTAGSAAKAAAAQAAAVAASDPAGSAAAAVNVHNADFTNVHGVDDMTALETVTGAQAKASAAAAASIPLAQKGAALGVATLDVAGKLSGAQIPAISLVNYLGVSNDEADMLALNGQPGDWTTRNDTGTTWIITGGDPTVLANWTELSYPTAPVTSVAGRTGSVVVTATDVGLAAVANLAPADLPISDDTQDALDLKAPLNSPAFTGTPTGLTKAHVGLAAADNTSDLNKPVSTATQAALDLKANLASPAFTGTPTGITKTHVGLGNVSNLAPADLPVSTAQQTALDAKLSAASNLSDLANAGTARTNLGLGDAATKNTGTSAGTLAAGDDSRILNSVQKTANIRYLADHIPAGTDTTTTDCSTYLQAAVTAAGVGGTVIVNGRIRCDTEITLLNYQTIQGSAVWMGTGAGITTNCLDFSHITANPAKSNQKVGFRVAQGNIFRNLLIAGPGPTVTSSRGISTDDGVPSSPRFHNVQVYSWEHGVHLEGGYYTRFYDSDFQYNAVGLYANLCYNLNLYGCKFTCRNTSPGTVYYTGIQIVGAARGLKMFGGSIEDYSTAIQAASNSDIALYGVYFESPNYVHANGVVANGLTGCAILASGCTVYLTNHDNWINIASGTQMSLVGQGNKFIYPQYDVPNNILVAPTTPIAYNLGLTAGDVDLRGDDWKDVFYFTNQPTGYTSNAWTSNVANPANYHVRFPLNDQNNRHLNTYEGRNLVQPGSKTVTTGGLRVYEQSNGKQGVATLVAGTVTVANTSVTSTSRIFLTAQSPGGTPGWVRVSARTAGTSFTITSSSGTDTSVIAYQIFEPG